MKIELSHTITLQSGYAFLEIEVLHNASDMAAFLESLQKNEVLFEEPLQTRAKREMQNLGFLDSNNSLTKEGKKLIETKQRYIKECGKYKIDFSLDDDIFDNRIFKVKREKVNEDETELEQIDFGNDPYLLLDDKNKRLDKIITTTAKIQKNGTTQSHITYQRFYEIDSKGNVIQDKEELNGIAIEADENFLDTQSFIQKYEQALGPNWDKTNLAYRIDENELNEFLEEQVIKDIRTLTAHCTAKDFTFSKMPLYPKEESDAKYILTLCLLKDLSESYLTQDDLDSKLESYINHKGLNEFLQTANKKEYIKDLESSLKQEKDKTAFWHYYAINDLLPMEKK